MVWAATESNGLVSPTDPAQSTTMPQRIAQRKNAINAQLTTARQQRLVKQCAVAQTGIQQIKIKDTAAANTRRETYTKLATRLSTIIDRLERQSINTTALKTAQDAFTRAINQYLKNAISYKTAMDDIVIMDCAKDPLGFEATLLSTRQLRARLSSDTARVKTAVPLLTQELDKAKQELIEKENDGGGE